MVFKFGGNVFNLEMFVLVMGECIFCKIVSGDAPTEKVMESNNFFAFKDINGKAPGHTLIVPKKHIENFLEMEGGLYEEFMKFAGDVSVKVMEEVGLNSFNMLINNGRAAGQVVFHLHLHIIPRKEGDGYEID